MTGNGENSSDRVGLMSGCLLFVIGPVYFAINLLRSVSDLTTKYIISVKVRGSAFKWFHLVYVIKLDCIVII